MVLTLGSPTPCMHLLCLLMDDYQIVVIDNGSFTKVGFAGDDYPTSLFSSVVGVPKNTDRGNVPLQNSYVGGDAQSRSDILDIINPIKSGTVTNWHDLERIWHHTFFRALKVNPTECPVFLTEPILTARAHSEKVVQIMFETFNTPAMFIGSGPILSLYSVGRSTGIVVDVGDTTTSIVPIVDSYAFTSPFAVHKIDLGGADITDYLMKMLGQQEHYFTRDIANQIKESHTYISPDIENQTLPNSPNTYSLPDGKTINIGEMGYLGPEILFKPSLIGKERDGIHTTTFGSILKCDEAVRKRLFANILICGGSSMFYGFVDRMNKELASLASYIPFNIIAPCERQFSSWVGASMLSSLPSFSQRWISVEEYNESGPSVGRGCHF